MRQHVRAEVQLVSFAHDGLCRLTAVASLRGPVPHPGYSNGIQAPGVPPDGGSKALSPLEECQQQLAQIETLLVDSPDDATLLQVKQDLYVVHQEGHDMLWQRSYMVGDGVSCHAVWHVPGLLPPPQ